MIDLLRSEWIKARTVRVNWVLGAFAFAVPVVVIVLITVLISNPREVADDFVGNVTGFMVLTALLLGTIGALNLTSEYSHGTIRTTFAASPNRSKVLTAKALVTLATTIVAAAITELATFAIGSAILSARDVDIELTGSDRAALFGAVVLAAMLSWLGFGLGLLVRNSPATVVTLVLWPLLLENIARGVLSAAGVENPTAWLPYQSAITMANPDIEPGEPTRLHGALYLGTLVLVMIIVGTFVNERRDA